MNDARAFIDTNVLVYLVSGDVRKANVAEDIVERGGTVSVQVLNEFVAVARRKMRLELPEIRDVLDVVRRVCEVSVLDAHVHEVGLDLMERYSLAVYDSMIVAAALTSGCQVLFSEDMQAGLSVRGLRIINPFVV